MNPIILIVENSKTFLQNCPEDILNALDQRLRYPSEVAIAKEHNIEFDEEMNIWDGWVRMLHVPKTIPPWFLTGLIGYALGVIHQFNYPYYIDDRRVRPVDDLPETVHIPLRDYQKEAADAAVEYGRGVLDMVPRSGKTRIACEVQRKLGRNTLWLAPTREIVKQTKRTLDSFFWESYSCILGGKSALQVAKKSRVVLCTPNMAIRLPQEFFDTRECIIVDEFHHSATSTYHSIFKKCDHIYYRFGMTGTFFRSGQDEMALHSILANTLYKVTSADLIDKGFLVPINVVFLPMIGTLRIKKGAYQVAHGKHGIMENLYRNQLVSQVAVVLQRANRSVLILVNTKKQGNILKKIIDSFYKDSVSTFVHSGTPDNVLKDTLRSFIDKTETKILIGTSVLGEGVDLPTADSLVYATGQKAEVSLLQNAYRVGTAVEGKTHAVLVDFADRHHKKLLEHSMERARVYHEQPTFSVDVLDDINQFKSWLSERKYQEY